MKSGRSNTPPRPMDHASARDVRRRFRSTGGVLPILDVALELRDLENPLLPGYGVEGDAIPEREHHVPGCHEDQFGQGPIDGRQDLFQRTYGLSDPLDRDAGVYQSLGSLEGDQVFERVPAVSPRRLHTRGDQVGLRPVLELPARNPKDFDHVAGAEQGPISHDWKSPPHLLAASVGPVSAKSQPRSRENCSVCGE